MPSPTPSRASTPPTRHPSSRSWPRRGPGRWPPPCPRVVADGSDVEARGEAQYGAWLCGAVLAATTMSLHHKLCHTLGGTLDLPHAQTHTVVLPHALAYNAPAAPEAVAALSRALGGVPDPAGELWELAGRLGAPRSLRELGMAEDDIPRVAELAAANPYANPRPVTRHGIEALLRTAWTGAPPPSSAPLNQTRPTTERSRT